uniref:rRNA-processing protein FYV7 n=1 Tax=Panagrolaimus davidi TaxID=227884 RepID=A0A914P212_9BILA
MPKPAENEISLVEGPQDDEQSKPETSAKKSRKRKQSKPSDGLTAFQRAKKQYEKIQDERREEAKKRRIENEKRENERLDAMSFRRRKDQAIKSRTKKGQPNLNAVMGCIVEKLMKEKEKKN